MALEFINAEWLTRILNGVEAEFKEAFTSLEERHRRVPSLKKLPQVPKIVSVTRSLPEAWFEEKLHYEMQSIGRGVAELRLALPDGHQATCLQNMVVALGEYQHSCGTWTMVQATLDFLSRNPLTLTSKGEEEAVELLTDNLEDELADFLFCCVQGSSLKKNKLVELLEKVRPHVLDCWTGECLLPLVESYRFLFRHGLFPRTASVLTGWPWEGPPTFSLGPSWAPTTMN